MIFEDQAQFMTAAGQTIFKAGRTNQADMYATLIKEEANEFLETQEAGYVGYRTDDIKEAVDTIVVAAGYLISVLGLEGAQKAWDLVHATNMAKVEGPVQKRDDGKVIVDKEWKANMKAELKKSLALL